MAALCYPYSSFLLQNFYPDFCLWDIQDNAVSIIVVCGAVTMAAGIAQVAAVAGFAVILYEVNEVVLHRSKSKLENELQKLVDK
jgi:hypothetical protein